MSISPLDLASLSSNLAQFKGQALTSLFDSGTPAWNAGPLAGMSRDTRFFNGLGNKLLDFRSALD